MDINKLYETMDASWEDALIRGFSTPGGPAQPTGTEAVEQKPEEPKPEAEPEK